MPFAVHQSIDTLHLELQGDVTIRQAGELAARIAEVLDGCTQVVVDTSGLRDVDTCILQLLCSLQKTAARIAFPRPSAEFVAMVDRCGLRRELSGAIREAS
jgi:anti-anti-sigma regulatory factor